MNSRRHTGDMPAAYSMLFKEYGDAVISLMLDEPFYAHILSELLPILSTEVPIAGVMYSTPVKLLLNREQFSNLKLTHRTGVLVHEILHLVMEHFARRGSRSPELFNLAADLAVNELIGDKRLPPNAVTVSSLSQSMNIKLPRKASAEVYYDILEQNALKVSVTVEQDNTAAGTGPKNSGGSGSSDDSNDSTGGKNIRIRVRITRPDGTSVTYDQFDDHGAGDDGSPEASVAREIARELVRQMVERAVKSCGRVPAGLEEYIEALQKTHVNWRRVLSRFLLGRGKMVAQPSYLRENKRYDSYPGKRKQVGMEALIAIDTSGSMGESELADIIAHLNQIRKLSGTKMYVVWGDTRLEGGPVPLEKLRSRVKIKGRGGTDLCWPFELASKMRIGTVVYFTDGYGPVPEHVNQRVLWVITPEGQPPTDKYGYVVTMELLPGRANNSCIQEVPF